MTTPNPLQQLINTQAIKAAEAQYRLARLYTPFGFEPERPDYDRMADFLDDPYRPFQAATPNMRASLDKTVATLTEARGLIAALSAQGVEPTLTADQLYATARANLVNPSMARVA